MAFYKSISKHNIKIEDFVNINICYRCYALDDHIAKDCPKDKNYKICEECASTDHTLKNCKANIKKCMNCEEDHITSANTCPVMKDRKKKVKKRKESTNLQPSHSFRYSNIQNICELQHRKGNGNQGTDMYDSYSLN